MKAVFRNIWIVTLAVSFAAAPAYARKKAKYDIPPWDEDVAPYKSMTESNRSGYMFNSKTSNLISEQHRKDYDAAVDEKERKCKAKKSAGCETENNTGSAAVKVRINSGYKFDDDGDIIDSDETPVTAGGGSSGMRKLTQWQSSSRGSGGAGGAAGAGAESLGGLGSMGGSGAGGGGMGNISGMLGGMGAGKGGAGAVTDSIVKNAMQKGGAGGMDMQQLLKQAGAAGGGK